MKEALISVISLVVGAVVGYWSHIFKQNHDLSRQADLKTLEKIKGEYPLNSCFLNPNPQMQLSARNKVSDKELDKLISYRDRNRVDMGFYFHNKKMNEIYGELRSLLNEFCFLVLENFDHADGCYENIYSLKGRDSMEDLERNNFNALVNEIDNLGERVIKTYIKFITLANKELRCSEQL